MKTKQTPQFVKDYVKTIKKNCFMYRQNEIDILLQQAPKDKLKEFLNDKSLVNKSLIEYDKNSKSLFCLSVFFHHDSRIKGFYYEVHNLVNALMDCFYFSCYISKQLENVGIKQDVDSLKMMYKNMFYDYCISKKMNLIIEQHNPNL